MPKRPRQAHIPLQSKRRRTRRPAPGSADAANVLPIAAASDEAIEDDSSPRAAPESPARTRRRLDAVRAPREAAVIYRASPGQLPTFERSYLMRELRQITITATLLLGVIVILAVVLR
jgi:hypothetical protein